MSASESSESDEMTAEEQNQRNCEQDDIHRVISTFMQSREESLEELVGGFLYLTMDDVRKSSNPAVMAALRKQTDHDGDYTELAVGTVSTGNADGASLEPVSAKTSVRIEQKSSPTGGDCRGRNTENDELEEEVLECLDNAPAAHSLLRNRPASLTKFDNFVMTEDDLGDDVGDDAGDDSEKASDDEWMMNTSGYMASFDTTLKDKLEPDDSDGGETTSADNPPSPSEADEKTGLSTLPDTDRPAARQKAVQNVPLLQSHEDVNFGALADAGVSVVTDDSVRPESSSRPLNPGEADEEEEEHVPVAQTVSILEFSTMTVVKTSDSQTQSVTDATEECSDEVVPFVLDEDFDYDNVAYTPKYTQAEMEYLTSFLPQQS